MEIRENGLPELSILDLITKEFNHVEFDDNAYDVTLSYNDELDGRTFNYYYSSLTKPPRIIAYDLLDNNKDILWRKEIVSFNQDDYQDNRFFIESRDGAQVPVITIAHKSTEL